MRVLTLFLAAAFAFAPLATLAAPPATTMKPPLQKSGTGQLMLALNGKPSPPIEVSSFQWGVGRGITSPAGGSADRESSAPSVSEITLSLHSSKTSTFKCATGEHIKTATLTTATQKIVMTDLVVLTCRSAGPTAPAETVSFTFQKIEWT